MGTNVLINGLSQQMAHVVKGTDTDTINERSAYIRKTLVTLEAHASIEHHINSNESLSPQGKADALKKLGTNQTAPALKWIREEITKLEAKDQRWRSEFYTIESGIKDPAERMPIFVYLWSKFDTLDQSTRVTQFLEAAEQDKVVVLSAMVQHPLGAMVPEEVREAALLDRAKRLTPEQVHYFEQTQIKLEFMIMLRDWLARWLFGEVGVEIPVLRTNLGDEIADMLAQQVTGIPAA